MAIKNMPPHWVDPITKAQRKLSIPDLSAQGLPRPAHGVRTSFIATGTTPILDVGIVDAVKHGRVEVVAAVDGFDGGDVLLADGSRIASRDTVIITEGTGVTRLVKIDAWSILLYDVRRERIDAGFPWNKDIAMESRRNTCHRTGKRVCHQPCKHKTAVLPL